jgi:hypothetical protein
MVAYLKLLTENVQKLLAICTEFKRKESNLPNTQLVMFAVVTEGNGTVAKLTVWVRVCLLRNWPR